VEVLRVGRFKGRCWVLGSKVGELTRAGGAPAKASRRPRLLRTLWTPEPLGFPGLIGLLRLSGLPTFWASLDPLDSADSPDPRDSLDSPNSPDSRDSLGLPGLSGLPGLPGTSRGSQSPGAPKTVWTPQTCTLKFHFNIGVKSCRIPHGLVREGSLGKKTSLGATTVAARRQKKY
jgi:hypothetical protein